MTTASPNLSGDAASPYIKEITAQNFMAEVVQASLQVPVLVYFTAPWCGPCKQYGPTLEKLVGDAKGRLRLARVDVDKNPQLAQQFRIQSVPMVFIFLQGQPLDGFAGALTESQLKQMLAQVMGEGPEDELAKATLEAAAQLLAQGDAEQAGQMYEALLAEDKTNVAALAGFASAQIMLGKLTEAEATLQLVAPEQVNNEAVIAATAALKLAKAAPKSDAAALQHTLKANPDDHTARYGLASALFASGHQEQAMDELLTIIRKNRDWNEGAARAQLLTFFDALGNSHPLTMQGRRKLSTLLFS